MKTHSVKIAGLLLLIFSLSVSVSQCSEYSTEDPPESVLEEGSLTESQVQGMLFMREEEKLARDVYLYLYEIHPLRPFLNISKSEQAHMDAMKYLIDIYALEDPVGENAQGVFQNQELQILYNDLIEMGSESREAALKVGALIEEIDIIDLQNEIKQYENNEEVVRVYGNLSRASENHLRAFVRVLRLYDVGYQPEKLDQATFDRILEE